GSNGAYSAATNYDLVTGLGTPDVNVLVQSLAGSGNGAPVINSFSPNVGVPGTSVSISGANFNRASAVQFNGTDATFTVNSAFQIATTVPNNATTGPITVTTPQGTVTSAASFTVVPPATNDNFAS